MDNNKLKEYFIEKSQTDPQFIEKKFVPTLESLEARFHVELHQANRGNDLSKINYLQGKFDGIQDVWNSLIGIRASDSKKPAYSGLMNSIFGIGGKKDG